VFILGNLFIALGNVIDILLSIYMWVIIVAALISWVNPDPYNPIVRFLHRVTEPVLSPIRRRLGIYGGIDFSPLIVILGIVFARFFIVRSLIEIGFRLKGGLS